MSAAGGLLLKLGAVQIQHGGEIVETVRQIVFNWQILVGVLMYFIPVVIWIFLLKRVELGFLQPLFSMVYVVTPAFAMIFLNENVTPVRWLGIGTIVIGVIIVARS